MRWSGLGQTQSIIQTGPAAPPSQFTIPSEGINLGDGTLLIYPDGSKLVNSNDGSSYYLDKTGYWTTWQADGFKCWGDAISGGWMCQDGSSGGSWYTSPAASIKQKGQNSIAKAAASTPSTTPTTPAGATPSTPPATQPAAPPQVPNPNDPIVDTSQPDAAGGITYTFQSGASYYQTPDGAYTYIDASGYQQWGDAAGDVCDSYGYCWGPNYPGTSSSILDTLTTGNTPFYILGGLLILLLATSGGGRRR